MRATPSGLTFVTSKVSPLQRRVIRYPFDNLSVIPEFTSKRIAMFQKYSKEIAELGTKR
jgi:hypothetical protein